MLHGAQACLVAAEHRCWVLDRIRARSPESQAAEFDSTLTPAPVIADARVGVGEHGRFRSAAENDEFGRGGGR